MMQSLAGRTILVVEDETLTGMMLCNEIRLAGGISMGPMNSVADALMAIESVLVDAVVLDAKLVDGLGNNLGACLHQRRIPFVVISGYERASLPDELKSVPFIAKPISIPLLMEALEHLPRHSAADSMDGALRHPNANENPASRGRC